MTKIYIPLNIQRFASGTILLSNYNTGNYNITFQGKIEWSSVSNGSSNNSSNFTANLYARKQNASSATTGKTWSGSIIATDTTTGVNYGTNIDQSISRSIKNDWVLLATLTATIPHNDNGTKTLELYGSVTGPSGTSLANATSNGSEIITLDTIPRYTTVTHTILNVYEQSIQVQYNATNDCSYLWYSIDDGDSWVEVTSSAGSSGVFTISSGLVPEQSYDIKIKMRRKDSGIDSESETTTRKTHSYPYIERISNNKLTIGDSLTITVYNPLKRNCTAYIKQNSKNGTTLGSITGFEYGSSDYNLPIDTNAMYQSIPNSPSGNFVCYLVCNYPSASSPTIEGTYTINYDESRPNFSHFEFEVVDDLTYTLTQSRKSIIDGYSTIGVTISETNKATGFKGSTIKNYTINGTPYPYSDNFYQEIENFFEPELKIYAIDSRDNSKPAEEPVSLLGYKKVTKGEYFYERNNEGVGTQVTFTLQGKFWNKNFGSVDNELSIKYKFKKTGTNGDGEEIDIDSSLIEIDENGNYYFSQILEGDNADDSGFDIESSYNVTITVSDKLSSVEYNYTVIEGSPAIDLVGNCIALGAPYDESVGGRVQLDGQQLTKNSFAQMHTNQEATFQDGVWVQLEKWLDANLSVGGFECEPANGRIKIPAGSAEYIEISGMFAGYGNCLIMPKITDSNGDSGNFQFLYQGRTVGNGYWCLPISSKIFKINPIVDYYVTVEVMGYNGISFELNNGFGPSRSYIEVKKLL